jgi:hypothetical protein
MNSESSELTVKLRWREGGPDSHGFWGPLRQHERYAQEASDALVEKLVRSLGVHLKRRLLFALDRSIDELWGMKAERGPKRPGSPDRRGPTPGRRVADLAHMSPAMEDLFARYSALSLVQFKFRFLHYSSLLLTMTISGFAFFAKACQFDEDTARVLLEDGLAGSFGDIFPEAEGRIVSEVSVPNDLFERARGSQSPWREPVGAAQRALASYGHSLRDQLWKPIGPILIPFVFCVFVAILYVVARHEMDAERRQMLSTYWEHQEKLLEQDRLRMRDLTDAAKLGLEAVKRMSTVKPVPSAPLLAAGDPPAQLGNGSAQTRPAVP